MHAFTNHLSTETSPYLLQHAHNPVDWYPWGDEALTKALVDNKPILISIGYSACHWCHVMERESFEDEEIAAIMNSHFINIKIDREERPDLDHIYMDAVQTINGNGGWPLNVFLTPDRKPFYGGTYFPPRRMDNRPSWKDVLVSIADAFNTKKTEIEQQAESLTRHLAESNVLAKVNIDGEGFTRVFNTGTTEDILKHLMNQADTLDGGFGLAPKFPQTFSIQYLLNCHYHTENEIALRQACLSLDKMIAGGLYDHLGGGFARYATDNQWLVPHFEKMLYDNALLITVLSEAYQVTKKESYAQVIIQTIEFVKAEMLSPENGFYSAIDADSEGEEGKFYVWSKKEVEEVLGEASDVFCAYYDITATGNWEGKNILHTPVTLSKFAAQQKRDVDELSVELKKSSQKLWERRNKRIRPLLDDKIILGWNALMNAACTKAFEALGIEEYKQLAIDNMNFLLDRFKDDEYLFAHAFKNNQTKYSAFLDDHAFLVQALIQLQEITGETNYLEKAKSITEYVMAHFADPESGFFFYNHQAQLDIIVRKKEIYDGAVPSGNSTMMLNLLQLSILFDEPAWNRLAIEACAAIHGLIMKYPTSFGIWATVLQAITYVIPEVVITGEKLNPFRQELLSNFIPFKVFQSGSRENNYFPLLKGKPIAKEPQIFLCKGYNCQPPVTEIAEFIQFLKKVQNITP